MQMKQHDGNPWTDLDHGDKDGTTQKIVEKKVSLLMVLYAHKVLCKKSSGT